MKKLIALILIPSFSVSLIARQTVPQPKAATTTTPAKTTHTAISKKTKERKERERRRRLHHHIPNSQVKINE